MDINSAVISETDSETDSEIRSGVKEFRLSFSGITTRKGFHTALASCMSFPDYYGNNLDAMMDVLTDIGEPVCLTLTDTAELEEALPSYYKSILKVMDAAGRENPNFQFSIQ